jgi:hypothetical protein
MSFATAIDAVETAIDALGRADLDCIEVSDRGPLLIRAKLAQSKLDAHIGRATHAADAAGAFIGTGSRDTSEWLAKETGTSMRKNRTATELGEAMSKSSALADAVTSGSISSDKAVTVIGAAGNEVVDAALLSDVAGLPLNAVKPAVEEWRARNHPDRDADISDVQRNRRYLRLTDQPDGMTRVDGMLDSDSASTVRSALDGIMNLSTFDSTTRTREQRCADSFTQLCHATSKGEIKGGRSNTKLLAMAPFETITERAALRGRTHVGTTLDAATVRKLACDAGIHRVITGPGSSILDFGHETRLVSENLFLALVARDQHCRWPGCTIRATWCDAHHIIEWADGGPTTDENCALLCHRHHQLSHQPGWKIDGTGSELRVHHPSGNVEMSKPPSAQTPQTDSIGQKHRPDGARHPSTFPGSTPAVFDISAKQLTIV